MSRTYYEWMKAKRQWHIDQGYRIEHIPYPHESIEYPVVYTRKSTNDFWENRRDAAEKLTPHYQFTPIQESNIYNFIKTAGDFEQKKEEDFLSKFYTLESLQGATITDKFNLLFQSKANYDAINKRLKYIISTKQNEKNKTSKKHEYYTGMAPNLSSLFASYLETSLSTAMSKAREKITADMPLDRMRDLFEDAFETATLEASDKMTDIIIDNNYGVGDEWKPINEILQSDKNARDLFMGVIKQAVGTENIDTMLTTMRAQKNPAATKQTARTLVRKNLKLASQTAQIGGTVAEQAMTMLMKSILGLKGGAKNSAGELRFKFAGEGIYGNQVRTDSVMLFSTNLDVDLDSIMTELNEDLSSNKNMMEAYKKFQNFYNKTQKSMDELYAVFINSKNYSVGHDAHNYTQHQSGTMEELPGFLDRAGFSVGSVRNFLLTAYNTGKDTIRENIATQFMNDCVNALKAMAAKLMFDDYEQIGQGDAKSIHMFYLSGKYIPSSVVFHSMAEAFKEAKEQSKATVTLPGPAKYDGPHSYGIKAEHDADFKEKLMEKWREEAERVRTEAKWEVQFTLKIKQILAASVGINP